MVKIKKFGGANNASNNIRSNNIKTNNISSNTISSNNTISNNTNSNKKLIIIISVILAIIVLIIIGYSLYNYYTSVRQTYEITKQMIPYIHDASIDKRFNYGSLPESSEGNEYNMNFWVYINEYTYRLNEDKCILFKGDKSVVLNDSDKNQAINKYSNPGIWLLKHTNTLRINTGLDTTFKETCEEDNTNCSNEIDSCEIKNFPLQNWVNINVSLRNNILDVFLNGKLNKSCILSGSPTINKGDLYICQDGGFNGYISNFKYTNKALNSIKIYDIYKKGPQIELQKSFLDYFGYRVKVEKV
jgi:hypothetical protein